MNTNSWSFPNMFDVARNRVSTMTDATSIANRVKLLILTEPTELYMNPTFGVGLKRHLFKYNTDNEVAIIKDRIIEKLKIFEPSVNADATKVERGLKYTGQTESDLVGDDLNHLKLTVTLETIYGEQLVIDLDERDFNGLNL